MSRRQELALLLAHVALALALIAPILLAPVMRAPRKPATPTELVCHIDRERIDGELVEVSKCHEETFSD